MNDRALLERAAKAAGYKPTVYEDGGWLPLRHGLHKALWIPAIEKYWNPLEDDGDALRLAVKLRLQITPGTYGKDEFTAFAPALTGTCAEYWGSQQDDYAATRRAIVRAAASLAKDC